MTATAPNADEGLLLKAARLGTEHGLAAGEPLTEDKLMRRLGDGEFEQDPEPYAIAYMASFEAAWEESCGVPYDPDDPCDSE